MAGFSQLTVEKGLHQAAALAAMTLLITAHRAVMNTGFTLRARGWSTDFTTALTIGLITSAWTLLVVVSGVFLGDRPCRQDLEQCVARLAYAPWIIQVLFVFWAVALLDQQWYLSWKEARRSLEIGAPSDVEARRGVPGKAKEETAEEVAVLSQSSGKSSSSPGTALRTMQPEKRIGLKWARHLKPLKIWRMECSQGPLNWSGSVHWAFRTLLYASIGLVVASCSYGAARRELYTIALLNIVGVVLFIVGAGGSNRYTTAPHTYTRDTLRVILQTDHKEGTIYVLPTRERGFDAVWSPKIESEHAKIDAAVADWRAKGGFDQATLIDVYPFIAAFHSSTQLDKDDVISLADWLHDPAAHPAMSTIRCNRAPGIHLLSTSVMLSLRCAEYLVFMRRGQLRPDQAPYLGRIRSPRWTGADIPKDVAQIGSRPGLEGYQDAVRYIYQLFSQPVDESALRPDARPPKTSIVLAECPGTIEEYVAKLWDYCMTRGESTFAAMYAFCHYWMADIGSGHGWHSFPFRAVDREGDLVSWHIIWRQAWYLAIIAQLTSMSPIIFSAFLAGILQ